MLTCIKSLRGLNSTYACYSDLERPSKTTKTMPIRDKTVVRSDLISQLDKKLLSSLLFVQAFGPLGLATQRLARSTRPQVPQSCSALENTTQQRLRPGISGPQLPLLKQWGGLEIQGMVLPVFPGPRHTDPEEIRQKLSQKQGQLCWNQQDPSFIFNKSGLPNKVILIWKLLTNSNSLEVSKQQKDTYIVLLLFPSFLSFFQQLLSFSYFHQHLEFKYLSLPWPYSRLFPFLELFLKRICFLVVPNI